MELRHLRYFVAVAEELHFGRAAGKLRIAQPPLSQQIKRLEEELGLPLFERTRRKVSLTHAGQEFLKEARRTLAQAEHAVRVARRADQGEVGLLAVGFVDSALYQTLPPVLRIFHKRFPEVELALYKLGAADQFGMLREGRLHAGFVRTRVDGPWLRQEIIFREPFMAALPSSHPLAKREKICLQDLAGDPFVIFPRTRGPGFYDEIVGLCLAAGFSPRITQEAPGTQTVVSLVAAAIGVAVVPASITHVRIEGVVFKALHKPQAQTAMTLVWRPDDPSPVLQAFVQVVREFAHSLRRRAAAGPK
ncbi:MAG: LysR substrate-binding domain-containing protein [Terriglobia bacterium]